jgi:hypothetical protein
MSDQDQLSLTDPPEDERPVHLPVIDGGDDDKQQELPDARPRYLSVVPDPIPSDPPKPRRYYRQGAQLPVSIGVDVDSRRRKVELEFAKQGFRSRKRQSVAISSDWALPRPLMRIGLFSREQPGSEYTVQTKRIVPNGWVVTAGIRLSWFDARTVAVITGQTLRNAQNRSEFVLTPTKLATHLSGERASGPDVKRARDSLDRLCDARMSFSVDGYGQVGTEHKLESLMVRDPSDPDRYQLQPWFQEMLDRGFDREDKQAPYIESHIHASVPRLLKGLPVLLWFYLECENWKLDSITAVEAGQPGSFPTRRLILEEPFLNMFELQGLGSGKAMERIKNALRAIHVRDLRYRGFKTQTGHGGKHLFIWRINSRFDPAVHLYEGGLCERCGLPDPERICCCAADARCRDPACPTCQLP